MAKSSVCTDCKALWLEYAHAVHAHIETIRQSHADVLREDSQALMKSEWLERAAVRSRQKARKALTEHQVTHLISELEKRQKVPAK
jgi:hypothetical protein